MVTVQDSSLVSLVEKFFTAYNDMDLDTFGALLTDDVHFEHHNKFKGDGRETLINSVRDIQVNLPDRRFGHITRWSVKDNVVYAEHGWTATPAVTDETWGWQQGVPTSMEVVSVFVFEGSQITEWSDYG